MHKLIDYICEELDELERKADKDGKLSMAEIQYGDTLAHMKKNLLKAGEMMGEEYSEASYRNSREGGSYRGGGSYDGGSYREGGSSRDGESRARGRGRGRNARRDSMGRYSSRGSYEEGSSYGDDMSAMIDTIYDMMDELPESAKQDAKRFVQKLEKL